MIGEKKLPICKSCWHRRLVIIEETLNADGVRKEDDVTVQCAALDDCARAYSMGLRDGRERDDKARD